MRPAGPNADQITYWNDRAGPRWLAADEHMAAMLAPPSRLLLDRAAARPGERVLDVGCGTGQTSVLLAAQVGAGGTVLGVDISAPLLGRARERAAAQQLAHLDFLEADAQCHQFAPASFDLVVSRFGVMFFADPPTAFANLARATGPGGRLAFACWRATTVNNWLADAFAAIGKHVPLPPPAPPGAPGPFAFADPDHVTDILTRGGWRDINLDPFDQQLPLGVDVDDAMYFAVEVGATAQPLRDAEPSARAAALAELRTVYAAHRNDHGITMPGAIWLVTASR